MTIVAFNFAFMVAMFGLYFALGWGFLKAAPIAVVIGFISAGITWTFAK
jgi:hypothetical protein